MFRRLGAPLALVVATLIVPAPGASATSTGGSNVSYQRLVTAAAPLTIPRGSTRSVWTSPAFSPGFAFTELVASWNAETPVGSLVEIQMQASPNGSYWTKWYVMGRWTFIRAGIPLVASIAVDPNSLDGFLFKSSSGHLLVIAGITAEGNVVANDPAAVSDATVPRIYDRAQFEDAWLNHSGAIVYVIHPASTPLPPAPGQPNW